MADPAIGIGGGEVPPSENLARPGGKFQTIGESLPTGSSKQFVYKHA